VDFWDKNMALLEPSVLRACDSRDDDTSEYMIEKILKGGHPAAKVSFGSAMTIVQKVNTPPYNDLEPFMNMEVLDGATYIVFGFGMGYHLDLMVRQCRQKKNVKILVIEPLAHLLKLAAESRDLTEILAYPNMVLLLGSSYAQLERGLSNALGSDLLVEGRVKVMVLNSLIYKLPIYRDMIKYTKDFLNRFVVGRNTKLFFAEAWTKNFFTNLPMVLKSRRMESLFGRFGEIPVIIVAAGPSLDKNIHLLPKAKGKALIICAGTALRPILNVGIEPELVFALDGGQPQEKVFDKTKSETAMLCYAPEVYPSVPKMFSGRLVVFASGVMLKWMKSNIGGTGTLVGGPSVANFMFDFARRVSGGPIIFIGQDLAVQGGKSHASGTVYESGQVGNQRDLVEVEGIDGNKVLTRRDFHTMLVRFNMQIASTGKGIDVIDATEGGALIKGTKLMRFEDALSTYIRDEYPLDEILIGSLGEPISADLDVLELKNSLAQISVECAAVKSIADQGVRHGIEFESLFLQMKATKRKVDRIYSHILDCLEDIKGYEQFNLAGEQLLATSMMALRDISAISESHDIMSKEWGIVLARSYQGFFTGVSLACEKLQGFVQGLDEDID